MNKNRLFAFTMAEVLITLSILGVVIAMTLPSVVGKYQKIVATTQLKKIYNVIYNAYLMSVETNGESQGWMFPMTPEGTTVNKEQVEFFYNLYFAPFLNFKSSSYERYKVYNFNGDDTKIERQQTIADNGYFVRNPDGMCMILWANNQYMVFTADLNCEKSPNIVGKDVFDVFELYWQGNKTLVVPWLSGINDGTITRADLIESCKSHTYVSGVPSRCFALFVYDGMEFKKDYPWR